MAVDCREDGKCREPRSTSYPTGGALSPRPEGLPRSPNDRVGEIGRHGALNTMTNIMARWPLSYDRFVADACARSYPGRTTDTEAEPLCDDTGLGKQLPMTIRFVQEENMRNTIFILAILAPVAAFAATKPVGCALLGEAACKANRACAWSPPMVRGEKSSTTGKPYKITRRGYCHRRPSRR